MANAYTSPIDYGHAMSTMDIAQLTGQVQTALQQRFNINVAKVDDLIQKITTVPLVRDKDKKYLGDRLGSLLSMADANSKVDMTNNNVTRQISNYISTAIDDNVKEQISNSQKIQSFQQEAARIKKEKPELYNDANYAYALDKSGYIDYVNEESDSIGNLQYTPYYDVTKNLNEPLDKWAKEMGFEKVVDSSVEGGYIYKTVKGKSLTEEQIANFVENRIASDSNLRQQLMIDSHYKYRGVSDEDLLKNYKEAVKPILNTIDINIAEVDHQIKNTNPDDAEKLQILNQKKATLSSKRQLAESQANGEGFNRDSFLFNNHVNNLTESYKKTFGYAAVTDIDFNDDFLDAANKGSKSGAGLGVGNMQGLAAGTAFRRDLTDEEAKAYQEAEEKKGSVLKRYKDDRKVAKDSLDNTIKNQLLKEGKEVSSTNMTNYLVGLKNASKNGFDVNAQAYPSEVIDAYKKVEQYNKQSYQLAKKAEEFYGKDVNEIFNGLFGGKSKDLNVDGLAMTAPKTAEILKKYKSASEVPARDKILAQYEIAKNIRDYVLDDEEDKERMDFFIEGYKQKNKVSDKDIPQVKKEDSEYWSGLGDEIAGFFGYAWNTLPNFSKVFSRKEDREKAREESDAAARRYSDMFYKGIEKQDNAFNQAITSDTNLKYLQSGDIELNQYEGVVDRITGTKNSLKERFDEILDKNLADAPLKTSIVLNKDSKVDAAYISQIQAAIVAKGGSPDEDSKFMTIEGIENGFAKIIYTKQVLIPKEKGGQTKELITEPIDIDIRNLPPNLLSNIGEKANWDYSYKNPTPMKASFSYKPFNDLESRYNFTSKFLENNPGLSQEEVNYYQSSNFSTFKTREELINQAAKYLPAEDANLFVSTTLNADYAVEFERPNGGGAFIPYILKDGKKIKQENAMPINYSSSNFNIITATLINNYIESQISELRRQALYKQIM